MSYPFYDLATVGGAAKKHKKAKKAPKKGTGLFFSAHGYTRMLTYGTKRQVYNRKAHKTRGGLIKADLMKNKRGKIVSKAQHAAGVKAGNRLKKLGGAGFFGRIGDVHKIGLQAFRAGGRAAATKAPKRAVYEDEYARYGGAEMDPRYGGAQEDYSAFYY